MIAHPLATSLTSLGHCTPIHSAAGVSWPHVLLWIAIVGAAGAATGGIALAALWAARAHRSEHRDKPREP